MLNIIIEKAIQKKEFNNEEINFLINFPLTSIGELTIVANTVKKHFFQDTVALCSIINAKSGTCPEDCKFCAQSTHYNTNVDEYDFINPEKIRIQAKRYKELGIKNFSIVTSGTTIDDKSMPKLLEGIRIIKDAGLLADLSVGIMSEDQIKAVTKAGCTAFHHNLETSRSFFPEMCSTHDYDDDINTVKYAKNAGLYVCSGGIFGIGESWEQRIELAMTLKKLDVPSIPVNFLNPIPGTPYANIKIMSEAEALKIVAIYRFLLPDKHIRICGGRSAVFSAKTKQDVLSAGASGIMVGDYLTIKGFDLESDIKMLDDNGYELDV